MPCRAVSPFLSSVYIFCFEGDIAFISRRFLRFVAQLALPCSAPQGVTPTQKTTNPDGRRASLKTPPTPQFGPGWVEQQKQKFEGISSRSSAVDGAVPEEHEAGAEQSALDMSAEEHLDRLTLLLLAAPERRGFGRPPPRRRIRRGR